MFDKALERGKLIVDGLLRSPAILPGLLSVGILLGAGSAARAGAVDRLYVLDCGWAHAADQSLWSPGVNVGVPIDLSDNCYLIHHTSEGYLLWDTGIGDSVASLPDGLVVRALKETWHRAQSLTAALAAIGVKPEDIRYVGVSHAHPDHTGNIDEFPNATVIIQKTEWDAAKTLPPAFSFSPDHKMQLVEGDKDLFGDGSLTLLSTPGHTPGHQSLLVHLPKTGYVVLSGDVVHFQSNWENRRVPAFNSDKAQSAASMEKIERIVEEKHAQFWINHDKLSSDARLHAPDFYE
jgi:glyoxylase-like metal-dependent hydrolase (beta-lactamase superfamily II)